LTTVRLLIAFFDLPGFDDVRQGGGLRESDALFRGFFRSDASGRRRDVRVCQLVHQTLPGFLGECVEELIELREFHRLHYQMDLLCAPRVQEHVGVKIRKVPDQRCPEINWHSAEQSALLFKRESHDEIRGSADVLLTQEINGGIPATLAAKFSNCFDGQGSHTAL
jgi:hypothetical protein